MIAFLGVAILVAAVALDGEVSTKKRDPIFDALSTPASVNWGLPGSSPPATAMPRVASVSELLPRLEAKVLAKPDDAGLQILLVRTYLELNQRSKAEELVHKLYRRFPDDQRLPLLRARILMQSHDVFDLREAIALLEEDSRRRPTMAHLARLYQGQILLRLGERKQAMKVWRDFISTLAPGDERRKLLEVELEKMTSEHNTGGAS